LTISLRSCSIQPIPNTRFSLASRHVDDDMVRGLLGVNVNPGGPFLAIHGLSMVTASSCDVRLDRSRSYSKGRAARIDVHTEQTADHVVVDVRLPKGESGVRGSAG